MTAAVVGGMSWRRFLTLTLGLSAGSRWHQWRIHKPDDSEAGIRRAERELGLH